MDSTQTSEAQAAKAQSQLRMSEVEAHSECSLQLISACIQQGIHHSSICSTSRTSPLHLLPAGQLEEEQEGSRDQPGAGTSWHVKMMHQEEGRGRDG